MKRMFFTLIILLSFINIDSAVPAKTNDIKDVVVEGRRVIAETAAGKDLESRLLETRNKMEKEIKALDKELEQKVNDVKLRSRTVDAEALEKDKEKIKELAANREVKAKTSQEKLENMYNRELAKMTADIKDVVTQLAKEKGWNRVQLKETGEFIYVKDDFDVTSDVVRKHDLKFKASKTPAAKPTIPVVPSK